MSPPCLVVQSPNLERESDPRCYDTDFYSILPLGNMRKCMLWPRLNVSRLIATIKSFLTPFARRQAVKMRPSWVLSMILPVSLVHGHMNHTGFLEKRAFLPVQGATGPVLPRLEVRELQLRTTQWNIFLLSMQKMQTAPQANKVSYYQLAGIHGVPRVSWDGVTRCSTCTGQVDGYCTHSSVLFLGWHRAYVALFEQQLVATAKSLATQYTGAKRTTYERAASQLRLPYWDWAAQPASGPTLPTTVTATTVTVDTPSGSKIIANPLASYKFASTSGLVYSQYKIWLVSLNFVADRRDFI